jgi:hypothetical protein
MQPVSSATDVAVPPYDDLECWIRVPGNVYIFGGLVEGFYVLQERRWSEVLGFNPSEMMK